MELARFLSDFESLPEQIQQQVMDYVEYLRKKYQKESKKPEKFKFDWEDGLKEVGKGFTSVELQHKYHKKWNT